MPGVIDANRLAANGQDAGIANLRRDTGIILTALDLLAVLAGTDEKELSGLNGAIFEPLVRKAMSRVW